MMERFQSTTKKEISREEYITSLNQWLDHARLWGEYSRNYLICSGLANENASSFPNFDPSRSRQQRSVQNSGRNSRKVLCKH